MVYNHLNWVNGAFKLRTPVLEGLHDSQQFLVIDWIVGFGRYHGLREVADRVPFTVKPFLGKHCRDHGI